MTHLGNITSGLAAGLLLLTSGAALACPTSADLGGGIRVTSPDGEVETFTRTSEHIVTSAYRFEEGEGSDSMLAQGTYVVQLVDIYDGKPDPDTRQRYSYPLAAGDMPPPTPGGVWSTKAAALDADGLRAEHHEFTFGAQTSFTIGACTYAMIPITAIYKGEENFTEELFHLPDLGFALLRSYQEGDDQAEVYQFTGIEAVQK